VNFRIFAELIKIELKKEYLQWDVIRMKMKPWIDLRKMKKVYAPKKSIFGYLLN